MAININAWNLMYSMRSVQKWQDSLQTNINGAVRNGFKEHEVVFGGNAVYDALSPTLTSAGKQIGEQSISLGFTRNIWKQGNVVPTKSETDFAVRGNGFFAVADPLKTNWAANGIGAALYFNGNGQGAGNPQQAYLTRDGQFTWALVKDSTGTNVAVARGISANVDELVLVNAQGLVVLSEFSNGPADNSLAPVTYSSFISTNRTRPSIFQATQDPSNGVGNPNIIMENADLIYSRFGSTIFEAPKSSQFKAIVAGSNNINNFRSDTDFTDYSSQLIEQALEASNVNVEKQVTQLSDSKKLQEALVKQLLVFYMNIDVGIELIK